MKTILSIAALILSLSIGYYLVIYIPHKEEMKQNAVMTEQRRKEELLVNCMKQADTNYQNILENTCIQKTGQSNCLLSIQIIENTRKIRETEANNCKTVYGN